MNNPLNVLFVEDSVDDAQLVMLQLEQDGLLVNCRRVESEVEFTAALDPTPDLILSDYSLPGFNGPRALQIIHERALDIPFILISGTIGEEVAVEAMKQGADDYLMKDRLTRLGSAVKSVLNQKRLREEKARADLALRHSEARYHNIFQTAPVSIWEEDFTEAKALVDNLRAQGVTDFRAHFKDHTEIVKSAIQMIKVVDVNETTLRLYGVKDKTELLGDLEKFLTPDGFREELIALAEGKTYIEKETSAYTAHGKSLRLWLTQTFFTDENGRYKALICINDITERKLAETALRESEIKYRNLVERLTQVIYTTELGIQGAWSYVSPQIEKMLGFTPQEWISNPTLWYEQVHPDDRDKQIELEQQAYLQGEPFDGEYRISTRAGDWIWIRDSGQILPSQNGGQPVVQGILMDISDRKDSEAALSLSKAQLLANLDNTPNVAVQWYDGDGRVLYWNPASETLYGWKSSEAMGKTLDQLIHTPEEQAEFMRILGEIRETGKAFGPYEAQVHARDGGKNWVLATTFSLPMNGNQIGFVCMDVDITDRKQAEEQIQKQLSRLNALHSIDMAINSSVDMQITLEVLLNQVLYQLNADAADVLLFNQPAQTLELIVSRGFRSDPAQRSHQRLSESFTGRAINERRAIFIPNLMEEGRDPRQILLLANEAFLEYHAVPLIAKGQIKGVLEIYHRTSTVHREDWLNFLEVLAGQAAIAIDNSQLVQGLQHSNMELVMAYDATIEGWSRAMDLRDKETEGHTQRVTEMALRLAQSMNISESKMVHMRRGGLLHDIGKLGVPDNILLKPDKLTDEEWEKMRKHPGFAYDMLASIRYLQPALDIPYCHHEKWDGSGYPRGLRGEQIPLEARIFAVADVWDALTSDRPYRQAWSKERTFEFIKEQSGKHFDPQVVSAFLEMISTEL